MNNAADINLKLLRLDASNPRLPTTVGRKQDDMVAYIARTTSISEIMSAIAENDYFPGEPLIVIPDGKNFTVVEGNRRLTALLLLQDAPAYTKSKKLREIADGARFKPEDIPCVVFKTRDEVINYLGYRHITGVKQWEPLAKARYIADYFDNHTDEAADIYQRYVQVARGIGSHAPYIKRQLDGLAIYWEIEKRAFYEIADLDEENISFSLLSTAIGYESILLFCSRSPDPYIFRKKLNPDNIIHLAKWMFEKDEYGETTLGDSRNIQRLAVVVADIEALKGLISGDSLDRAYSKTKGISEDFSEILSSTESMITRAVSMVALVDIDDTHRSRISNIFKQAQVLRKQSEEG